MMYLLFVQHVLRACAVCTMHNNQFAALVLSVCCQDAATGKCDLLIADLDILLKQESITVN